MSKVIYEEGAKMRLIAKSYLIISLLCFVLVILSGGAFGRHEQPGQEMAGNIFGQITVSYFLITLFAWGVIATEKIWKRRGDAEQFPVKLNSSTGFATLLGIIIFVLMVVAQWITVYLGESYVAEFTQNGTFLMILIISFFKAMLISHGVVFGSILARSRLTIASRKGLLLLLCFVIYLFVPITHQLGFKRLDSLFFDTGLIAIPLFVVFYTEKWRLKRMRNKIV